MCTVSWKYRDSGYDVFFNRDELLSRKIAEPPIVHNFDGIRSIAPIDLNAHGTWLAVNEFGVTVFLLNHHPKPEIKFPQSRGDIVLRLMAMTAKEDFESSLAGLRLADYASFRLGVIFPGNFPRTYLWNGIELVREGIAKRFFSSSSYESTEVVSARLQTIAVAQPTSIEDFLQLHRSHEPEKNAFSICMHRDDAQTVSFSHIVVRDGKITFAYADGPPCCTPADFKIELTATRELIFGEATNSEVA